MPKEIILAFSDEWEAIYVDDKKQVEGHSIKAYEWYKLGRGNPDVPFASIKRAAISNAYVDDVGDFPSKFSAFPPDAIVETYTIHYK